MKTHDCPDLIAERVRLAMFLESLKRAQDDGRISTKAAWAIWSAYHAAYSTVDDDALAFVEAGA